MRRFLYLSLAILGLTNGMLAETDTSPLLPGSPSMLKSPLSRIQVRDLHILHFSPKKPNDHDVIIVSFLKKLNSTSAMAQATLFFNFYPDFRVPIQTPRAFRTFSEIALLTFIVSVLVCSSKRVVFKNLNHFWMTESRT